MYHRIIRALLKMPHTHRKFERNESGKQTSTKSPRMKSAPPFRFGGGRNRSGKVSHESAKIATAKPNRIRPVGFDVWEVEFSDSMRFGNAYAERPNEPR